MAITFESELKARADSDSAVAPLHAQWIYDQRLIAAALESVGRVFPHYSRHDSSHSNTILVQISRILGPRISLLSATDLWLLLEAAYHHDIGMVVTDAQIREWWPTKEFRTHLVELAQSEDPDLREAAATLRDPATIDPNEAWPADVQRALILVVADFARRKHPSRSEAVVRDPVGLIGLFSPRTSLIPARLFHLLGSICAHHGKSFDETMSLPFEESGLGVDVAHPRYIAFLLRLGDLLDLDNGRFCSVMMRSFGTLPSSSQAHVEKHAAITRFFVGPEKIEVEATCTSYDGYETASSWFRWLREEVQSQMVHRADIVPPEMGTLPGLGKLEVRLENYVPLKAGERPRFEVDRDAILNLVRGTNIYSEPLMCLREVLQNAVDATLVRAWRQEQDALKELREPNELRDYMKKYRITTSFVRAQTKASAEKILWNVKISDQGCGISFSELKFLQRTGSSGKNHERKMYIQSMPDWMRPSGVFGIGLQSIFMCTSEARITTRHFESAEAFQITIRNGAHGHADGFFVSRLGDTEARQTQAGTTVEFVLETHRIPPRVSFGDPDTKARKALRAFDPIVSTELPYEIARAEDVVAEFARGALCPIVLNGRELPPRTRKAGPVRFFDPEEMVELEVAAQGLQSGSLRVAFRGSEVERTSSPFDFLRLHCDLHAGSAQNYLRVSREKLTHEGNEAVVEKIGRALDRWLNSNFQGLRARTTGDAEGELLRCASLYAYLETELEEVLRGREWHDLQLVDGVTLGALVSVQDVEIQELPANSPMDDFYRLHAQVRDGHATVTSRNIPDWLYRLLRRAFVGYQIDAEAGGVVVIRFARTLLETVTPAALKAIIGRLREEDLTRRLIMPCPSDFEALAIARNAVLPYVQRLFLTLGDRMISPYVVEDSRVTVPHVREYIEWVQANALSPSIDCKTRGEALLHFIRTTQPFFPKQFTVDFDIKKLSEDLKDLPGAQAAATQSGR